MPMPWIRRILTAVAEAPPAPGQGLPGLIDVGLRVLICDDDADVRLLYREVMEAAGAFVAEAQDGEECMAVAELFQPEIVILDVILPGRSGMDVLVELRVYHPEAHILVVSGVISREQLDRSRALGAHDCVEKLQMLSRIPELLARFGRRA